MCEIGKPLEVIDSQPLVLPAPLRREKQPADRPLTVEVPVPGATVEPVSITVEKS
jgi:hypothetical protein